MATTKRPARPVPHETNRTADGISMTFPPTSAAVAAARNRILEVESRPSNEDMAVLLNAMFRGRRVTSKVFPLIARNIATMDSLGQHLALFMLLLAVRRKMDISAAVPFLEASFTDQWKNLFFPSECGFFEITRFLHNPPIEFNELLMRVIAEHYVRAKDPASLEALFEKHFNRINRVYGIWFALRTKSRGFRNLEDHLAKRCLGPGPED